MPELNENPENPSSTTARVIASPEASAQNCVVVERPYGLNRIEQMWIDSSSFLIRRVVEPRHVLGPLPLDVHDRLKNLHLEHTKFARTLAERAAREPTEVESVTTYDAAFDAEIAPSELRYVPPAQ